MSGPHGPPRELERRRRQAVRALADGPSRPARQAVAAVLGGHPNSVSRRAGAARRPAGLAGLAGSHPGLSAGDLRRLERLRVRGAKAPGRADELRTADRVAVVIARHSGRIDHPGRVRTTLTRRLRWTRRKPRRQARERDDQGGARRVGGEFPRVVREAFARAAHPAVPDESGFVPTPTVRRPRGPAGPPVGRPRRRRRPGDGSAGPVRPGLPAPRPRRAGGAVPGRVAPAAGAARRGVRPRPDPRPGEARAGVSGEAPRRGDGEAAGGRAGADPGRGRVGRAKSGRRANLAAEDADVVWDRATEELVTAEHSPDRLRRVLRQAERPGLSLAARPRTLPVRDAVAGGILTFQ